MEDKMDRRQRKTREAIFSAFIDLLSKKDFNHITVGEIIQCADIGRATFYAHFETKDFLLKEFCQELFCHIFDELRDTNSGHGHIFDCDAPDSVFLHLFQHLQNNDNNILKLLSGKNNELFLQYFKTNLQFLIAKEAPLLEEKKSQKLPESFWLNHVTCTFIETIRWWIENGKRESAETICEYFYLVL